MAPRYRIAGGDWLFHMAIVDNNGVPRFHRALDRGAMDFRPVRHPIAVHGQEVRYLLGRTLFSKDLQVIEAEIPWSANKNNHDFQITEHGTFVGINQESVNRDFSDFTDSDGNPYSVDEPVHDSVIREYPMSGPMPPEYGVSTAMGSVQDLDGRWMISWGIRHGSQVPANETISVSEIVPEDGRALLHLHMSHGGTPAFTYRVNRAPEVDLPLNLP